MCTVYEGDESQSCLLVKEGSRLESWLLRDNTEVGIIKIFRDASKHIDDAELGLRMTVIGRRIEEDGLPSGVHGMISAPEIPVNKGWLDVLQAIEELW